MTKRLPHTGKGALRLGAALSGLSTAAGISLLRALLLPAAPALAFLFFMAAALPPAPAWAASLEWKALPDRERVTLHLNPDDGMTGRVDRVAPDAVLVPFTALPPGLLINETPEGAKIFKNTLPMGRALALVTRTPEFGFVVDKQNPSELIVDFFPNPLGARWKRTGPATATELAPDRGLQPISAPDATSEALIADPEGQAAQSRFLEESARRAATRNGTQSSPAPRTPPAPDIPPIAPPPAAAASPTPVAPATSVPPPPLMPTAQAAPAASVPLPSPMPAASPPAQTQARSQAQESTPTPVSTAGVPAAQPVPGAAPSSNSSPVPALFGTPEHALRATSMGEAPLTEAPRRSDLPGPDGNAPPRAGAGGTETRNDATQPFQLYLPPLPEPETAPAPPAGQGQQTPDPPAGQVQRASAPVPFPDRGSQFSAQVQGGESARPGVGVRAGSSVYSGNINSGGPEDMAAGVYRGETSDTGDVSPVETEAVPAPIAGQTPEEAARTQDAQASVQPAPQPQAAPTGGAQPATQSPAQPAQSSTQPATQPQDKTEAIVYTDEKGNPIEPPPEYSVLHPQILEHMRNGEFKEALAAVDLLLEKATLDKEQRGNLLHARSESLFALHKDNIPEHFQELYDAAVQAVNYDPDSRLNSAEYLRLGYLNLRMNNPAEAEANFNMLRRRFPDRDNVALSHYYWGDYHYGRNELQKAADQFQHLIREYPNSRYTREAAIGLARSLYRMSYYDQAWSVVDYINRRWERFYIQYPPFLNMTADTAYRMGRKDEALKNYWLYINLEPNGNESDIILTRIGDIYAGKSEKKAAREVYLESALRYPDKDGGLVAMMRMAEEGIHDNPTVAGMFTVFEGPFSLGPQEVYRTIIEKHPDSSLVPVAEMKLALWHLWNKDYDRTLELLSDFLKKHPDHELAPRAREIAQQTFAVLAAEGAAEGRSTMLRELWERYPIVRREPEAMTPESRISLALSYRSQGKPDEALRLVEPFFLGDMIPGYSDTALSMVLSIYLQYEQWNSVREVAKRVEFWTLPAESRRQLDYALALAEENMGESDAAAVLWQKLYDSGALSPAQQAYAAFFLAMGAERARRLEQAYHLGREALSGLETQMQRASDPADAAKIRTQLASLMDVTESAGRLRESLEYAERYLNSLPENDPERLAVRYRMARIHKSQGDAETWKNMLTEIASGFPDSVYGKLAASELKAASIAEDAARYSPTGRL
ncbi:MAG: tetratricopeptide repeat protein [Desulfovibrio sp.]|jgi:TolA-binding protein|nr:tetratricopeptide repeat protein [Desulfovibrio sp.]